MGSILSGIAQNSMSPQRATLGYGAEGPFDPRSLGPLDCLDFSLTTQATIGYGDITPISGLAKVGTIIQAAFGYFYLAFLFAALASKVVVRSKGIKPTSAERRRTVKYRERAIRSPGR